jgi:hypothetical protein
MIAAVVISFSFPLALLLNIRRYLPLNYRLSNANGNESERITVIKRGFKW